MNKQTSLTLAQLAVLGGDPAFAEPLHVGRPNIGDRARFMDRVNDMLDRRWLTNGGPFVKEFEAKLADYLGVKHFIAACNATVAIEIATRAAGLEGEVIVPSFTFVATAHALQWQQITPVFADINPATHNIDPAAVEKMITPRTTGIMAVHVWGRACDTEALADIARRYDLRLIYDAAHAFGCSHGGQMIGGFGDAEIFSFHATKFFNTFEGGGVATNDDELARRIRLMKNFGFVNYDHVDYIGTNGKMSEISAAMGLTLFEELDVLLATNRRNYEAYRTGLRDIPGLILIDYDDSEQRNYQYVIVEIDADSFGLTRDELVAVLHRENVLARRYFYPGCHKMEPYRSYFPHAGLLLPQTERLTERVMSLPTGTAVDSAAVARVCAIIRAAQSQAGAVRAALAEG